MIDRVPDELWTEVHDIVQETGIKTIPMEKKCKKAKWLSEETLQIALKRREVKSKGEKERYTHLNVEFQSHFFMENRWGNNGNGDRLNFLGLQNHCRWRLQP